MNWYILNKDQIILDWNEEKNTYLKNSRGIAFEMVEEAIKKGNLLDMTAHPNQIKYPHQHMLIVLIDDYTCCVPCIVKGYHVFLKTVYPSRKIKKGLIL